MLPLDLPATDHRVVIGKRYDYLIGKGVAHTISKQGLYVLTGPVPAVLGDFLPPDEAAKVDGQIGPKPQRD
jgi:hypothetical protein